MAVELRAASWEDFDTVAAILDAHGGAMDGDMLRGEWSSPDVDLARDGRVVVDGEAIVGYALAPLEDGRVQSWGVVAPDRRGEGIGTLLLEWIVEFGGARGVLQHAIDGDDVAAAALLDAHGFGVVRRFRHLRIELPAPARTAPEDVDVAVADDLRIVHDVVEDAFAEHWGHVPKPFDAWMASHRSAPGHDTALWFLARVDGEPVGALTAEAMNPTRGWVLELGVLKAGRRRGMGAALLQASFAAFTERGCADVLLNVDAGNETGALVVYERAGMTVFRRFDVYERP